MKIEYFAGDCSDCPLILIYGSEAVGARNLRLAIERLVVGLTSRLAIHEFPGYSSIDGCQLFASVGQVDLGVRQLGDGAIFECILRKDTWEEVMGLLDPFTDDDAVHHGHQYLTTTGKISLLISTDRSW
ncbi:MAG: hypothetical protein H6660_11190 [Ardenticatenaceae bacterium]|nr:hypothetical protein [Ardenticatenaceae bacterium]